VKLVLGTAVAIDILLQFFTYSTTPTTPKEAINHFFFFFCLQRENPIPPEPANEFYSIFPDAILFLFSQQQKNKTIPKPQTSISNSTNDRRKPK
jgi:hypothetical protein